MNHRCCYCGKDGADLRINARDFGHRPCFEEWDRADELAMFNAMGMPAIPSPEELQVRTAIGFPSIAVRLGARFGHLTVVRQVRRWGRRAWEVRCDCGHVHVRETTALTSRNVSACSRCATRKTNAAQAAAAERFGGLTVTELARRAGVSKTAIKQRIRLGWPVSRLAEPSRRAA